MSKPSRKRDRKKNPGLEKNLFSRIKQEFHDIDYADKLDQETKEWLSNFYEEDLGANFKHKGEKLMNKDQERASYRRNNSRNRDIFSRARGIGKLVYHSDLHDDTEDKNHSKDGVTRVQIIEEQSYDPTDDIIELIDKKHSKE